MRSALRSFLLVAISLGLAPHAGAQATGRVVAQLTENGRPAPGRFVVHGPGGEEVARAVSGTPVRVPPGAYDVAMFLEGAIDRPEKWVQELSVGAGATERVSVAFETGTVELRVSANGRRAAARIVVHRAGEDADVATLGAGVPGVLSAGMWDFQVIYRTQEKWLRGERIAAGSRHALTADF